MDKEDAGKVGAYFYNGLAFINFDEDNFSINLVNMNLDVNIYFHGCDNSDTLNVFSF